MTLKLKTGDQLENSSGDFVGKIVQVGREYAITGSGGVKGPNLYQLALYAEKAGLKKARTDHLKKALCSAYFHHDKMQKAVLEDLGDLEAQVRAGDRDIEMREGGSLTYIVDTIAGEQSGIVKAIEFFGFEKVGVKKVKGKWFALNGKRIEGEGVDDLRELEFADEALQDYADKVAECLNKTLYLPSGADLAFRWNEGSFVLELGVDWDMYSEDLIERSNPAKVSKDAAVAAAARRLCEQVRKIDGGKGKLTAAGRKTVMRAIEESHGAATDEWGFDLTDFKPKGFQHVLKALGMRLVSVQPAPDEGFHWLGKGVVIVTGNDPITGKYARAGRRRDEKNYASYIGVFGEAPRVALAAKLIKKYASSIKEETPHKARFIGLAPGLKTPWLPSTSKNPKVKPAKSLRLSPAESFFYSNAGYSRDPEKETMEQGHVRSAQELARAEAEGKTRGLDVIWEPEQERYEDVYGSDEDGTQEKIESGELLCLHGRIEDEGGNVLASLGMVTVNNERDPYLRVVAAELMSEALFELEKTEGPGRITRGLAGRRNPSAMRIALDEWGFDLTDFKPKGFQHVLKALGMRLVSVQPAPDEGFHWLGKGVVIVTGNDPITGKYAQAGIRRDEKNYASYIGVFGEAPRVALAAKLIKKYASSIKEETPHKAGFIFLAPGLKTPWLPSTSKNPKMTPGELATIIAEARAHIAYYGSKANPVGMIVEEKWIISAIGDDHRARYASFDYYPGTGGLKHAAVTPRLIHATRFDSRDEAQFALKEYAPAGGYAWRVESLHMQRRAMKPGR